MMIFLLNCMNYQDHVPIATPIDQDTALCRREGRCHVEKINQPPLGPVYCNKTTTASNDRELYLISHRYDHPPACWHVIAMLQQI